MPNYFLYNGPLERGPDLEFIEFIDASQSEKHCTLFLVTPGGNPDAAFKIGRYLQDRFEKLTVVVPGLCKSAGTLLAIAANELAFTPYGELGPLDVQMSKEDKMTGLESGLNTSEAFIALEARARETFHTIWTDLLGMSNGVVTFQTASGCAAQMVNALYGPIFAGIDAEEVGSRSRAMRIGEDYGMRLALKAKNVKDRSVERLARSYPSHGFVIDYLEASGLFEKVRLANEIEAKMIGDLGNLARFPEGRPSFRLLKPEDYIVEDDKEPKRSEQNGEDKASRARAPKGATGGDGASSGTSG